MGQQALAIATFEPVEIAHAAPLGSERTRVDTNAVAVDHERLQQGIANWASTLSPGWQKPAAILATFPADVLASLVEMLSAPETIATGGAKPVIGALDAAASAASKTSAVATSVAKAGASKVATKEMAKDLATLGIGDARINAGIRTGGRLKEAAQAIREAVATPKPPVAATPTPAAAAPVVAPVVAEVAPVARAANALPNQKLLNELALAARRAKVTLTPDAEQAAIAAVEQGATPAAAVAKVGAPIPTAASAAPAAPAAPTAQKLRLTIKSSDELKEFQRLVGRGVTTKDALEQIAQMRDLAARLGGATPSEVAKAAARRNTTGKW